MTTDDMNTTPQPKKYPKYPRDTQPHKWKTGTDLLTHQQYRAWLQQRNQAQWRGEVWQLPFDSWLELWADQWHLRGRTSAHSMMTRRDTAGAWSVTNTHVITRQQHGQNQLAQRAAGYRSSARQRELAGSIKNQQKNP